MKKVTLPPAQSEIDWSVPQWVQAKTDADFIVLTTGDHKDDKFEGTCLPCEENPCGRYFKSWYKTSFRRLEGSIPFTISND